MLNLHQLTAFLLGSGWARRALCAQSTLIVCVAFIILLFSFSVPYNFYVVFYYGKQ